MKFKYDQEAYLKSTGEKVNIKAVIDDYVSKQTTYLLDNGDSVSGECLLLQPISTPKKRRKKSSIPPVEKVDQLIESQEVEKLEENEENASKL